MNLIRYSVPFILSNKFMGVELLIILFVVPFKQGLLPKCLGGLMIVNCTGQFNAWVQCLWVASIRATPTSVNLGHCVCKVHLCPLSYLPDPVRLTGTIYQPLLDHSVKHLF